MHENHAEWLIGPSRRQRVQDVAAFLACALLLVTGLAGAWKLWALIPALGALGYSLKLPAPVFIGHSSDGWWIYQRGERQPLNFHGGSIRRRGLLVLVWGFWPWQVVRVRSDSFVNPERFRHLKYALYGQI